MTATRSELGARLEAALPAERISTTTLPGLGERPLVSPGEPEEWSAVLELASAERWTVLVTGNATKLGWCPPPHGVDLVLGTLGYAGVTSYEPGDGTVAARAGTAMEELAATVAEGGHLLSPDVAPGSTLGGVVAAGESGLDRLAHGPVRHNVLGTRVCLADGSLARSGGQLVKNVTGYDLHRLHTGSHGTLCVVLEVALRLYPLASAHAALIRTCARLEEALDAARRILALPVRPTAVVVDERETAGARLTALFDGRDDVLRWEVERVRESVEGLEPALGAEARRIHEEARGRERPRTDGPSLRLACLPSRLAGALAGVGRAATAAGLVARATAHPGVACATLRLAGPDGEPADASALRALQKALPELRADVSWRDLPPEVAAELAAAVPAPPGLALMRRLKHALDPDGVFAPGRFHGI